MKQITSNIYQIDLGAVNAYLIEDNGLTLIDTGLKNNMDKIFSDIKKSGKNPTNIKQIILTHCHSDHAGSVAAIKKELKVPVFAHEIDAALIEKGIAHRPTTLTPGIINWLVYNFFVKKAENKVEAVIVEEKLKDNDVLPIAGGIQVIHTPGHCAGHISLLVKSEGVLIAGDICSNIFGPDYCPVYEDRELGRKSILKAAGFSFDKAVFGHGNLLKDGANEKLKEKFSKAL